MVYVWEELLGGREGLGELGMSGLMMRMRRFIASHKSSGSRRRDDDLLC